MSKIDIPKNVSVVMGVLYDSGFPSYVVGGCVRDSLIGIEPNDWDICTSATPEQMKHLFEKANLKVIDTGIKHGTVTVVTEFGNIEITTFRKDGHYSDNRRPDDVSFVSNIDDDIGRRDFTVNSIAYNDTDGFIDLHDGIGDLDRRTIKCVGIPDDRFIEDPLRILRGMRFSSVYGFNIDTATAVSMHKNKDKLRNISAERVQSELCKMIMGGNVLQILVEFSDVVSTIIPEMLPCVGFDQRNRHHQYNVYEHIAHAVDNYRGGDLSVRIALLLHDIGKPDCYSEDEKGGHFYGHPVFSVWHAEHILNRLRFDSKTKSEVIELIKYHDASIEPTKKTVRRWIGKIGSERFRQLIDVKIADSEAHSFDTQQPWILKYESLKSLLAEVVEQESCFAVTDLAINGHDIIDLGVPEGKLVGEVLRHVLELVVSEVIENDFDIEVHEAEQYILGLRAND